MQLNNQLWKIMKMEKYVLKVKLWKKNLFLKMKIQNINTKH